MSGKSGPGNRDPQDNGRWSERPSDCSFVGIKETGGSESASPSDERTEQLPGKKFESF